MTDDARRRYARLVLVSLAFLVVPLAAAATLENVEVSAPTQYSGHIEDWTFRFKTVGAVATGGDIRVQLPNGFGTSAGSPTQCNITFPYAMQGVTTTVVSYTEVVCELGGGNAIAANTSVTVVLTNIRNPAQAGLTQNFTIETRTQANVVIDTHSTNTETIVAAPQFSPTGLNVSAPQQMAGVIETWTFKFTIKHTIPANGDVHVRFPHGFQILSDPPTQCQWTSPPNPYGSTIGTSATDVLCILDGATSVPANTTMVFGIANVRNPTTAQTTLPFLIETRDDNDVILDMEANNTETIDVHPFSAGPMQEQSDTSPGAVAIHTFSFTPFNTWGAYDYLELTFPPGYAFDVAGPGTTVAAFIEGGSGSFGVPHIDNRTLVFPRQFGASISGGTPIVINVTQVRNPSSPGLSGSFRVTTSNQTGADHDTGVVAAPRIGLPPTTPVFDADPTSDTTPANQNRNTAPKRSPTSGVLVAIGVMGLLAVALRRRE